MSQITLWELLKDEDYRKFFRQVPKLPEHYKGHKPWKLYILLKGHTNWKAKRYETYAEAVAALKKFRPKAIDAAINNPALGFRPPIKNVRLKGKTDKVQGKATTAFRSIIWRPKLEADHEAHIWCPYCRRPTVFKVLAARFKTTNGSTLVTEPKLRCSICSVSDELVNIKNPEKEQAWDTAKPPLYEIYRK